MHTGERLLVCLCSCLRACVPACRLPVCVKSVRCVAPGMTAWYYILAVFRCGIGKWPLTNDAATHALLLSSSLTLLRALPLAPLAHITTTSPQRNHRQRHLRVPSEGRKHIRHC